MKSFGISFIFLIQLLGSDIKAQNLYFPPLTGNTWETLSPDSLGWCQDKIDALYDFLETTNTKGFIYLKNGKIVLEKYFGTFTQDSIWYWASAGKTLTAFMVGLAQQDGFLTLNQKTSDFLGNGWTSCTPEQENQITVWHQLTMTSGLDDGVSDAYCTLPSCLLYKADAGTRWAYHNGPYTLLDGVIESATGVSLNQYVNQKIRTTTGLTGLFVQIGYNNVFFSRLRSMARFGLLMLNNGNWNGNQIMTDQAYFNQMITTSQDLNKSYGYLWWLNGKSSYMVPGLQLQIPGKLFNLAPNDMYSALGKNGQIINVIPSRNEVIVRMGNTPGEGEVSVLYNDSIFKRINELPCVLSTASTSLNQKFELSPNPASNFILVNGLIANEPIDVLNPLGQTVLKFTSTETTFILDVSSLQNGVYLLRKNDGKTLKFIKK
jgi:CubicO group peptidase (beta-lactamase class C family)